MRNIARKDALRTSIAIDATDATDATGSQDIVEQELVEELLSACEPDCPKSCVFPLSLTVESCKKCMQCHGVHYDDSDGQLWSIRGDCKNFCEKEKLGSDACGRCHGFRKAVTKQCIDNDGITFTRDGRVGPAPGKDGALPINCEKVRAKPISARVVYCTKSAAEHCPEACGTCEKEK